jgi:hypothetical protein
LILRPGAIAGLSFTTSVVPLQATDAKGIQEGKAMAVTGHKTNSMYKRYGIEELDSQRDALDAVTV